MNTKILGVGLAAALFLSACGGDDDGGAAAPATPAVDPTIRLANTITARNLALNGVGISTTTSTISIPSVASGAVSAKVSTPTQTYTTSVTDLTAGTPLSPATLSLGLSGGTNYTLLAYERSGAVNTFLLADTLTEPAANFALLAVSNAAGDAGTLDVYLVGAGAPVTGLTPTFPSVASRSTTTPRTQAAGTYDIVVTAVSKPTDVRLRVSNVTLPSTKAIVLALTSTIGGGLVNGVLIEQGGTTISLKPSLEARVRVVGAIPPVGATNAAVAVTVGGAPSGVLGTITSPSVGAYQRVTLPQGGTATYTVAVDGTPVAPPAFTFANGGDYTLLVSGTAIAPVVAVLSDQNQPSNSGFAHVRLINGAVNGGITLSINFLPINNNVPYGAASEYAPTASASNSLLQITSPIAAFPPYQQSNVNIVGSGVYTVFVLGSTSAPVISLSKDR